MRRLGDRFIFTVLLQCPRLPVVSDPGTTCPLLLLGLKKLSVTQPRGCAPRSRALLTRARLAFPTPLTLTCLHSPRPMSSMSPGEAWPGSLLSVSASTQGPVGC